MLKLRSTAANFPFAGTQNPRVRVSLRTPGTPAREPLESTGGDCKFLVLLETLEPSSGRRYRAPDQAFDHHQET